MVVRTSHVPFALRTTSDMGKNHDPDEVPDGVWWLAYFWIDIGVALLEIGFLIPLLCLEVGLWILFGGNDDKKGT